MTVTVTAPAISCRGVSKKFSGKYAVHDVTVDVAAGRVHAIVGENGAGKSTLLGMISGRLATDEGAITIFAEDLRAGDPRESRRHGLAVVYQELTMVPSLTAVENVFLGQLDAHNGFVRQRDMRRRFLELTSDFELAIDPDVPVRNLSISQQQLLEIIRGVQANGRILVLDEPSAALAESEREVLYRVLGTLKEQGSTIVFVSHNLDEVLLLSDTITVMRDGEVIGARPRAEWDKRSLVRAMVGRDVHVQRHAERRRLDDESFAVENVSLPGALHRIAVSARKGEIIGLWGLVGSGRTTFLRSLVGLEPGSSGTLRLAGRECPWPKNVRDAVRSGVVLVPESRGSALVMNMNASANFWLGRRSLTKVFLSPRRERLAVEGTARFFGFDARRIGDAVANLSGGNQQKVLLAKWAGYQPDVLLVDEPTRGIDIGAKSEVMSSLSRLAEEGTTIIMTSSELEEVIRISDRLLVFSHGRVVHEVDTAHEDYTVEQIVKFGFGEVENP
ncbi:sugar ABC transporter ATP-binding protein [Leekyejoonella antrihumi]|uniref:Sugar ABC transporter ATP-binding protein n=1 Tax=Leekyejoonella antrihumi TaxID=1660198 RepID=A0A563DWA6_9MICO|nr:sugar ABC transporter ATP-binding protein [Leekyejoonella antrihumi]TWP34485.1 sugar ABC transporter ATP-binding protein [Leekyejoonella antrihumi]